MTFGMRAASVFGLILTFLSLSARAGSWADISTCVNAIAEGCAEADCGKVGSCWLQNRGSGSVDLGNTTLVWVNIVCGTIDPNVYFGSGCSTYIPYGTPGSSSPDGAICPSRQSGSIVDIDSQTVGESIPIAVTLPL